jgi:catechol 2,3-dioxygenase-like lactoylglutathione lyase family enzyme
MSTPTIELRMVKLSVDDLQAASDFYARCFGMVEGARHNQWEWALGWPETGEGNTELILVCDPDGRLPHRFGPAWLLLRVADLDACLGELRSAGARDVGERRSLPEHGVEIAIARDPFGNILELVSPVS